MPRKSRYPRRKTKPRTEIDRAMSTELQLYSKVRQDDLLKFYEHRWHLFGNLPTPEDAAQYLGVKVDGVLEVLNSTGFRNAAERRGIELSTNTSLSAEQLATANLMLDYTDTRTHAQKLKALGVKQATYQGWLANPAFHEYIQGRAENVLEKIGTAEATNALLKLTTKGNFQAAKLILELNGRHKDSTSLNVEFFLQRVIEIIGTHLEDQDTLMAIAQDFEKLTKEL